MEDRKATLTILWIFAAINFLYADVLALFDHVDSGKSFNLTQGALIGASVLVEIPMAMIVLSWLLKYSAARWTNIIAGAAYTMVTLVTQFILPMLDGTTTSYYLFFGGIEILTTAFIVWYAWKWPNPEVGPRKAATSQPS